MSKDGTRQDRWELVGRALWLLREALEPPLSRAIPTVDREIYRRLQQRKGTDSTDLNDVQTLLNVLAHSPDLRTHLLAHEAAGYQAVLNLVELRNWWAHQRPISKSTLEETLTDAQTLLTLIGNDEAAAAVQQLQQDDPPSLKEARLNRRDADLRQAEARFQAQLHEITSLDEAEIEQQRAELGAGALALQQQQEQLAEREANLALREQHADRQDARLHDRDIQLKRREEEAANVEGYLDQKEQELEQRQQQLDAAGAPALPAQPPLEADYGPCLRPHCGGVLVPKFRMRDAHAFLGCSRFRTTGCRFARSMPLADEPELGPCPRCRAPLVIRDSEEGGYYLGCADFPNCDYALDYEPPRAAAAPHLLIPQPAAQRSGAPAAD